MSTFERTRTPNLVRNTKTGDYYIRARVAGQLIRRSLKTKNFAIAETKVGKMIKDERGRINTARAVGPEQSRLRHVIDAYLVRMKSDSTTTDSTKEYYEQCVKVVGRVWAPQMDKPAVRVTEAMCRTLVAGIRKADGKHYSPTPQNAMTDVLRAIFDLAISLGIRTDNPAKVLTKTPVKPKQMKVPTAEQFTAILKYLDATPACREARVVVRWLAYTGMRIGEAASITPAMVNLGRLEINVPGYVGAERITKNGLGRAVPIIGEMVPLLTTLLADYEASGRRGPLLPAAGVRYSLFSACDAAKAQRITHHDLRHLFATRCIEAGVDIPTISRWLGHQDGGVLCMRTYGHLRNEHSQRMALLVKFGT